MGGVEVEKGGVGWGVVWWGGDKAGSWVRGIMVGGGYGWGTQ